MIENPTLVSTDRAGASPAACALRAAILMLATVATGLLCSPSRGQEDEARTVAATVKDAAAAPAKPEDAQEAPEFDFVSEVMPIFATHCVSCHGKDKQSGGLRLDKQDAAQAGGYSGRPIIGGTLETNEVYRRVSSTDRSYRMPKNSEPLLPDEIERVRQWVEAGSPWPVIKEFKKSDLPFYSRWLEMWLTFAQKYTYEFEYALPFTWAFLISQFFLLLISRVRAARRAGRPWAMRLGRFGTWCGNIRSTELVLVWVLLICLVGLATMRGHLLRLDQDLVAAQKERDKATSNWSKSVFGYPPKPIRPDHPKQVAGTYYRGNCERNDALFNRGNYLTATMRVSLCDSQRRPIGVGDPIPEDGRVLVKLEIDRAPGTSDQLYEPQMMSSVYLTHSFFDSNSKHNTLEDEPVQLETLEPMQRFVAYCPVNPPDKKGISAGLIYVYTARKLEDGTLRGDPHYGIQYDLVFQDGTLSEESDLWMNAFGNGVFQDPPIPGLLPFTEWFDYRPMPEIQGENTRDPKLIGVEEYVRKGLIDPPKANKEKDEQQEPAEEGKD